MDPISIGLLLGSTALSGIGAAGEAKAKNKFLQENLGSDLQQIQQDLQAAQLRNEVLARYRTDLNRFADENQGNFNAGLATIAPVGARLDTATGARTGTINNALGPGITTADISFRAGAPTSTSAEYTQRLGDAFSKASERGGRLGALGAYGDFMGANVRDISSTGEKVKTTNQLASGQAQLLPYEQDLAAYKAESPIFRSGAPDVPWWSTLAKGLGKVGGAFGGGGLKF